MRNKKKAAIELQFNWIYIAIVGAVFLMIFIGIAGTVRKAGRDTYEKDALTYFDEIFTGMQGSENTEHTINLEDLEIDLKDPNAYKIGSQSEPTDYMPVFGPDLVKKQMVGYSLGWDAPFRASYFLYLSSRDMAYVLVGGASALAPDLPHNITKKKVNAPNDFENKNYYKVRFVTYDDPSGMTLKDSVKRMKDSDVTAVWFNTADKSATYFVKKNNKLSPVSGGVTYYFDKPTMLAVLFSENKKNYEANMEKAARRLGQMAALLKARSDTIQAIPNPPCQASKYATASAKLSTIQTELNSYTLTQAKVASILAASAELNAINDDLNTKFCPTIY